MDSLIVPLSLTELILLRELSRGSNIDEIAMHFRMNRASIIAELRSACAKLNARTETQAVAIAVTKGWFVLTETYHATELSVPGSIYMPPAETELFDLLGRPEFVELTAVEFAWKFHVSPTTIKRRLHEIYFALGVRGRTGAAFLSAGIPVLSRKERMFWE